MSIQDRLMADLKTAMREGNVERREAIRMIRAAVLNDEIERQHSLSEQEMVRVLQKLASRHQDSIEQFSRGGRDDLVGHEQAQLAVVKEYLADLPQPMGREEIEAHVRAAISELGASGRGDLGKVMQRLSAELRGKAEMKDVNRVAQELLGA